MSDYLRGADDDIAQRRFAKSCGEKEEYDKDKIRCTECGLVVYTSREGKCLHCYREKRESAGIRDLCKSLRHPNESPQGKEM